MSATIDSYAPSQANIEELRGILSEQFGVVVTFEEAQEVGIQLVSLYECLMRERSGLEEGGDDSTN